MNHTRRLLRDLRAMGRPATSDHRAYSRLPYGQIDWVIGGQGYPFLNICFGDKPMADYPPDTTFEFVSRLRMPAWIEVLSALVDKGWAVWSPVKSFVSRDGNLFWQSSSGGFYCRRLTDE